jgi:hypothetical protein
MRLLRPMAAAIHSDAGCCRWSFITHLVNVLKERGKLVLPFAQGIAPVMDTGDAK